MANPFHHVVGVGTKRKSVDSVGGLNAVPTGVVALPTGAYAPDGIHRAVFESIDATQKSPFYDKKVGSGFVFGFGGTIRAANPLNEGSV